eukprot:COSAG01_NODE_24990_length_759_cov_1.110606_1_plen_77_part_00
MHVRLMSVTQKEAVEVANKLSNELFLQLWQKAMCSRDARIAARAVIDNALQSVVVSGEQLVRIMFDLITKSKNCTQ